MPRSAQSGGYVVAEGPLRAGQWRKSMTRGRGTVVWVRVADWMIADGEVPVPRPGDVLRGLGVRWQGEVSSAAPEVSDGIEQLTLGSSASDVTHRVTGWASDARDFHVDMDPGVRDHGTDFVLAVGTVRFQVQCAGCAADVLEGTRVSVTGRASVIGSYEWDGFDLADVRRDWHVDGVRPPDDEGVMVILHPVSGFGPGVHDIALAAPA